MADDFLSILFSGEAVGPTQAEIEAAERAEMAAERSTRAALEIANRCPKCMGEGRLSQFSHRKGGECFTCGGTGVFARYAA